MLHLLDAYIMPGNRKHSMLNNSLSQLVYVQCLCWVHHAPTNYCLALGLVHFEWGPCVVWRPWSSVSIERPLNPKRTRHASKKLRNRMKPREYQSKSNPRHSIYWNLYQAAGVFFSGSNRHPKYQVVFEKEWNSFRSQISCFLLVPSHCLPHIMLE